MSDDDLVNRLRDAPEQYVAYRAVDALLWDQAADTIEALTVERDRLVVALNEFIAALNAGKTTAWDNDGGLTLDRYENAYRNLRDALKEG